MDQNTNIDDIISNKELMDKALQYKRSTIANSLNTQNQFFQTISKVISFLQLLGLLFIPASIIYFLCAKFTSYDTKYLQVSFEIIKIVTIYSLVFLIIKFIFESIRLYLTKSKISCLSIPHIFVCSLLFIALIYSIISVLTFIKHYGLDDVVLPGNYYNNEGLYTILMYSVIMVASLLINHYSIKKIFLYFMLLVGFATSLATLIILFTRVNTTDEFLAYRYVSNVFNNSNHYGYYTCIISLIASAMIVYSDKKWEMILCSILLIPFELCLLISKTLGSNLGFLFGIIFIILSYIIKNKKISYQLFILVIIAIIVFLVSEFSNLTDMLKDYTSMNNGISAISEDATSEVAKKSGSSRWGLWLGTIDCIKQAPWLGKGLDCYYGLNRFDQSLDMPHNEYLQIASNIGLPVAILYVLAIVSTFILAIKYRHFLSNINLICLAAMFGYCISAFFGNTFTYTYPYYLIIWAFAIPNINNKQIKLEYKRNK